MVTCKKCEFWNKEKKHCADPLSWIDEVSKEEVCRYREGATQRPQSSEGPVERLVTLRCRKSGCPRTRKIRFDNSMPEETEVIVSFCPWHEQDTDFEEYYDKDGKQLAM